MGVPAVLSLGGNPQLTLAAEVDEVEEDDALDEVLVVDVLVVVVEEVVEVVLVELEVLACKMRYSKNRQAPR